MEVQGENWIHPKHWHGSKEYLSWDWCGMLQKNMVQFFSSIDTLQGS